jgi:hypothetical protein
MLAAVEVKILCMKLKIGLIVRIVKELMNKSERRKGAHWAKYGS